VLETGAGEHSDYWAFTRVSYYLFIFTTIFFQGPDGNLQAVKIDDWYRFTPNPPNKGLNIEQAEEQFKQRNNVLNQFALKAKIQQTLKEQQDLEAASSNGLVSL
jgi:hypothetical protein